MARSAGAGAILDLVSRHPALRELPLASTTLLLRAIGAMRELDQSVLRFGNRVPDPAALARVLNVDPGEAAALLPGLLECDLLRQDTSGALYSPLLLELEERRQAQADRRRAIEEASAQAGEDPVSPRTLASRLNGARGGRPSTRTTAGQRQMPLMQVVAGADGNPTGSAMGSGLGSSSITQRVSPLALAEAETKAGSEEEQKVEGSRAGASEAAAETHGNPATKPTAETHGTKPEGETHGASDDQVEVPALTRDLLSLAGIARPPSNGDLATVRGWLSQELTVPTIRDTVRAAVAGAKAPIRHLGYFQQAMDEARVMARRAKPVLEEAVAVPREDGRLRPRQADESEEVYLRRTKGLRPLVPPAREPQEDAESYRRRLKRRFDIEVITAQSAGAPVPDWEAYAAGAQLAA